MRRGDRLHVMKVGSLLAAFGLRHSLKTMFLEACEHLLLNVNVLYLWTVKVRSGCNFSSSLCLVLPFRAAQKLNLSSKKKKQKAALAAVPVTSSPSCDPPLFSTNFCSALMKAPPPAPPCLLRAANKIKDTPGLGKVKTIFVSLLLNIYSYFWFGLFTSGTRYTCRVN